jgi:hypothetical protein
VQVQEDHGAFHDAARIRMGEAGSQVALLIVVEVLVEVLVKEVHLHVS